MAPNSRGFLHGLGMLLLLFLVQLCGLAHAAPGNCKTALTELSKAHYGYCPCECQSREGFSCDKCPITCKRYFNRCKPKQACRKPPPTVTGATWDPVCSRVAAGAQCFARCGQGFQGNGAVARCKANGWKQPINLCKPVAQQQQQQQAAAAVGKVCDGLPEPIAGAPGWPEACRGKAWGRYCSAKCKPGFEGKYLSRCKKGTWSVPKDECVALQAAAQSATATTAPATPAVVSEGCGGLPGSVANAQEWPSTCSTIKMGSYCSTKCKEGFTGKAYAQCKSNGKWGMPKDDCVAAAPAQLPEQQVPKQVVTEEATQAAPAPAPKLEDVVACPELPAPVPSAQAWPESCVGSKKGRYCKTPCQPGYTGSGVLVLCKEMGWSLPKDECVPISKAVCKGNPPTVPGAAWGNCDGLQAGERCTANCTRFGTAGGYTSKCGASGRWRRPTGSACVDVTCKGSPQAVEGATWPDCTGWRVGEQCTASSCNEGYKGMGYIANCMADGTWWDIWGDCKKEGGGVQVESAPSSG